MYFAQPIISTLLLSLIATGAFAYGDSQSSGHHCEKPTFSEFQPAPNVYLQSFKEFSIVASSNTVPTSISVNLSAGQAKFHFSAKELEINQMKNGKYAISGKLERAIEHGFIRVSITGHHKPGCDKTEGYLVRVN